MNGKHLESPEGGENALPHPKDKGELASTHKMGKKIASSETAPEGENHRMKTPDMMGTLFGHKKNEHGV